MLSIFANILNMDNENPQEQKDQSQESRIKEIKPNPENIQIVDIDKKLEEHKRKKRKFYIKLAISIILFIVLAATIASFIVIRERLRRNKPIINEPTVIIEPEPVEQYSKYSNDEIKVNFEYPSEALLRENLEGDVKSVEVVYSNVLDDLTEVNESSLSDGYIFRITKLKSYNRDLEQATKVKRASFVQKCPESATISDLYETNLKDFEALQFDAQNCGSDYIILYTPNFDHFYEFAQIYSGDVGYRQKYGAVTQRILNSFSFYPPEEVPLEETKTYINTDLGFSFKHPHLNETCCTIESPVEKIEPLIILGRQNLFEGGDDYEDYNIMGVFAAKYDRKIDYGTYIERQKQTLIDDYIVVKGTEPDTKDTLIDIGDRVGNLLEGYSWQEYEYVYIDISDIKEGHALILSIKNVSDEVFDTILSAIYNSFEFFESD